jgi:hypothetical protein
VHSRSALLLHAAAMSSGSLPSATPGSHKPKPKAKRRITVASLEGFDADDLDLGSLHRGTLLDAADMGAAAAGAAAGARFHLCMSAACAGNHERELKVLHAAVKERHSTSSCWLLAATVQQPMLRAPEDSIAMSCCSCLTPCALHACCWWALQDQ